jgi:hypothetical protein
MVARQRARTIRRFAVILGFGLFAQDAVGLVAPGAVVEQAVAQLDGGGVGAHGTENYEGDEGDAHRACGAKDGHILSFGGYHFA